MTDKTALRQLIEAVEAGEILPPQELLKFLLSYYPQDGKLFWRERPDWMFKRDRDCKAWNARYSGREAFTTTVKGYRSGNIFNRSFYAHRVILAMTDGEWPELTDHINGNKQDNRRENLRSVDHVTNMQNLPMSGLNQTGCPGVFWVDDKKRYAVNINRDGRQVFIGHYKYEREAFIARRAAERALGYHLNHGRKMEART